MKALRWVLGIVAVVIVLVVIAIAAGAAWLNNYIKSDAFRQEVETRAAQTLGGTVEIDKVDFDIFNGVKLQGFVTQIDPRHAGGQGAVLIKVESVNCTYAWKEIFDRRLQLTGITLDKPQIVLTKEETTPAPPQPPVGGPDSGATQGEGTAMPFQFILDSAKINNGTISVRDASGTSQIELQGLNVKADTSGYTSGRGVTGSIQIADMALPSNMHATNFSSPFVFHAGSGGLELKPFQATSFGGSIAGDYLSGASTASVLNLNGKGLDVAQVTAATNSSSSAKLSGSLDLQSKWRSIESGVMNGEGDATLSNGKLEGVKILQDLAGILRVNELAAPPISKAQTHFVVQNQQTQFIGLQLDSTIFRITGDGVVGFNGAVNANLVLILTKDAMGKLPSQVASSFVQQADGTGSIAFQVTGTTSNPQTDLPERLLLQNTQIKNVINKALDKFFH